MRAVVMVLACTAAFGQTFEVASVKPSPPIHEGDRVFFGPPLGGPGTSDPGQITWTYTTLRRLLMTAFDVKMYQVNGPGWFDTERYDIVAKVPVGATKEQVNLMWQALLVERFGVKLHHESKEFQVFELVIAKGGHKLKENTEDAETPPGPPKFDKNTGLSGPGQISMITMGANGPSAHTFGRAQPLSQLTQLLGNQMNRPVLDKTGLTGRFDYQLEFTPDLKGVPAPPGPAVTPADTATEPGTNLASALQQQLGLRLVASKATLDVLVIEKAEKVPTEN